MIYQNRKYSIVILHRCWFGVDAIHVNSTVTRWTQKLWHWRHEPGPKEQLHNLKTNDRKWQGATLCRVKTCTEGGQSVVRMDRRLVFSFLADELHEKEFFFLTKDPRCRWSKPTCQGQTVKRKFEKEEEKKNQKESRLIGWADSPPPGPRLK